MQARKRQGVFERARRRAAPVALLLAAATPVGIAAPAGAQTTWEYAQTRDPENGSIRHTLQVKLDYNGAMAALAFVCARGMLVLSVVSTWPITNVLRFRFPPEEVQWISGMTPVPSSAVFQGAAVRKLFETAMVRREIYVRIPGPRTLNEKALSLEGFAEKGQALKQACPE